MQPTLKPVEKKYEDYTRMRNEAGKKAVEEMLKLPCSLQEARENQEKLKAERRRKEKAIEK